MLDVRYSHLYFYQSLNRLQRGLSAIAELLVKISVGQKVVGQTSWLAHWEQKVGGQLPALPNRLRRQW